MGCERPPTTTTLSSCVATLVVLAVLVDWYPCRGATISGVQVGDVNAGCPEFSAPIPNVTVPVGRDAFLECTVDKLSNYKVAWLRVDTQTILTIHSHVITKNHRIGVTHSEHRTWYLHIRNVKETDRGWYMCQINTDPMKSQIGFLDVVVPPDILDYPTSADMAVREGSNVTFRCAAKGSPEPSITWRREGGEPISLGNGKEVLKAEGNEFRLVKVNRLQMGPYLCIASNGIPPSVSKRIMLTVHFPPMIWIPNQLIGAYEGQEVTLECNSEAYPKSINYWKKEDGTIITPGGKYEIETIESDYKVRMKLRILNLAHSDIGVYKCVSKNSLGEINSSIKIYRIPTPTTTAVFVPTTTVENLVFVEKVEPPQMDTKYSSDTASNFSDVTATETKIIISTPSNIHSYKTFDTWALSSSVDSTRNSHWFLACILLCNILHR